GPMQGRDTHGPTAMLRSVCKLPLDHAVGTPVLNIRLAKELFMSQEGRQKVIALVRAYFAMGGMQIQATVVDQSVLRDAIAHPEQHTDLIVRIGGYSEYFNNLTPELKQSVLERTEHL
ncbi:MAG TPA: glycine radical domain-containing protein, partial [Anaerolineae bacterium]